MQKQNSKKPLLIGVVVVVLLLGGYFYMSGKPTNSDSGLEEEAVSTVSPEVAQKATKIVALLREVKSLEIDQKFFAGGVYSSLMDFSVEVQPQNVGKANPFYTKPVVPGSTTGTSR